MNRKGIFIKLTGMILATALALPATVQPVTVLAEEVPVEIAGENLPEESLETVPESFSENGIKDETETEDVNPENGAELTEDAEPTGAEALPGGPVAAADVIKDNEVVALQVSASSITVSTQAELVAALTQAGTSGTATEIVLKKNIDISGTANKTNQLIVPAGADVTIRSQAGKQYTLKEMTEFSYDSKGVKHGLIINNGTLTLQDIILDSNGMGRGVVVNNSATLTLKSGAVLKNGAENFNSGDGLGVYVVEASAKAKGGTLYIRDGAEIIDNVAVGNGGANGAAKGIGVFVGDYGTMIMTGGKISNNQCTGVGNSGVFASAYSQCGGGLAAKYATVEISGGEISNNVSLDSGGGIYIDNAAVTLKGNAKVENNRVCLTELESYSDGIGGGVYVYSGTLTIEDDAVISGNIAETHQSERFGGCGGAVFINNGTVTMNGGVIRDNIANFEGAELSSDDAYTQTLYDAYLEGCGGGVFIEGGSFLQNGGLITENIAVSTRRASTSQGNGGGVFLGYTNGNGGTTNPETNGHFIFTGGTIKDNSVTGLGKDVYIADRLTTATTNMGQGASAVSIIGEVAGSPEFQVSGSPVAEEIYLPQPAECTLGSTVSTGTSRITLVDTLSADALLRVKAEAAAEGFVVAESGNGYSILSSDADYIQPLDEAFVCGLNSTGQIVLEPINEQNKTSLSDASVTVKDAVYTGTSIEPEVTVTLAGKILKAGVDYQVIYHNNVNAGIASVSVNGIFEYKGTAKGQFEIAPASLSGSGIEDAPVPDCYYTGTPIEILPEITFYGQELAAEKDYLIQYDNNTEVGIATVSVIGTGNFTGSRVLNFKIAGSSGYEAISSAEDLKAQLSKNQGSKAAPVTLLLTGDLALSEPLKTGDQTFVNILGNGYTVTMTTSAQATEEEPTKAMLQVMGSSQVALSNLKMDGQLNARIIYVAEAALLTADQYVILQRGAAANEIKKAYGGQLIFNEGAVSFDGRAERTRSVLRGYGGIYNAGTIELGKNSRIRNILTCFGGAVYNDVDGKLTLKGGMISESSTNAKASFGTGITNLGTVTMMSGSIENNEGAGAAVYNRGSFVMEDGRISFNTNSIATWGVGSRTHAISGGGVFQYAGTFVMKGGEISDNTAVEGGGVLVLSGTFTMDGSNALIKGNHAKDGIQSGTNGYNFGNGGGVFMNGGVFEMKAGKLIQNDAACFTVEGRVKSYSGYGSAIFLNGGTVRLSGGEISGNTGVEAYGSTNAIFFGNSSGIDRTEDDSSYPGEVAIVPSNYDAVLEISGSPKLEDDIFVKKDNVITVAGALDNITIPVTPMQLNNGNAIAKYAQDVAVNANDGKKFTSDRYSFIVNEKDKTIVAGADLADCGISVSDMPYTGSEITPDVQITDRNGQAVKGYTREVLSADKVNIGEKNVLIKGDGFSLIGEIRKTFRVTARELTEDMIVLEATDFTVTGEAIEPRVTVKVTRNQTADKKEYRVTYSDNVELGTATVTVTAVAGGNLSGTVSKQFHILKPEQEITAAKKSYSLTAVSADFLLEAVSKEGGKLSYESSDSSVAEVDETGLVHITGAGKATISVIAEETEDYRETVLKIAVNVSKAGQQITMAKASYNLQADAAAFSLDAKTSGDGELTYASSDETVATVDVTGKVTVKAAGEAGITITASETSNYRQASRTVLLTVAKAEQTITVKAAGSESSIKKAYGNKAFTLGAKADGKLTYKSSNKKVAAVSAAGKVTIKGCGVTTITVTAGATGRYNKAVRTISLQVAPKTPTVKTAKNTAAKTVTVTWAKDARATGYQIQYATNAKMKNAVIKTVTRNKKTSLELTGLKKGKTYYIQIREYYMVDKKTGSVLFGSFSKNKTVKVSR